MSEPLEEENKSQVQIISGADYKFQESNLSRLQITDKQSNMCVVSVYGMQGTGQSTFLNQCFGTNLRVSQLVISRKTTYGVTLCVRPGLYILDVEGFESQHDSSQIENRLALFTLYISDIVLVDIDVKEIGRGTSALSLMLHTILAAGLKTGKDQSKKILILALLRNPNRLKQNTLREQSVTLRSQTLEFFESVWQHVQGKPQGRNFIDLFAFDAVPLRYDSENDKLNEGDLEGVRTCIKGYNKDYDTNFHWICRHWKSADAAIVSNGRLDTLDFQDLIERERLEVEYMTIKPAIIQPWESKVQRSEPIDTTQALGSMILNSLSHLPARRFHSDKGREYIKNYINKDLSPTVKKWEEKYNQLVQTKITEILQVIKISIDSIVDKKQGKETFASNLQKVRGCISELETFPQYVALKPGMMGGAAQLLCKSRLRKLFFCSEDMKAMQVEKADLERRLNNFAELRELVLRQPRSTDFIPTFLQKYDHHLATLKAEQMLKEKSKALLVRATESTINVRDLLNALETEVVQAFNKEAHFTVSKLAEIPLAINIEAELSQLQTLRAKFEREATEAKTRENNRNAYRVTILTKALNEVIRTEPGIQIQAFSFNSDLKVEDHFSRKLRGYFEYVAPSGCKITNWIKGDLPLKDTQYHFKWKEEEVTTESIKLHCSVKHSLMFGLAPPSPQALSRMQCKISGDYEEKVMMDVRRTTEEALAYAEAEVSRRFP